MNKVLSTLLIIAMIVAMGTTSVFATKATTLTPGSLTPNTNVSGGTTIQTVGQNIMGVIQVVGIVIAVVILMIIGIKYMMGSAEEKAEYKKTMIPYIVGAVLIFAASTLANVAYNFAKSITG